MINHDFSSPHGSPMFGHSKYEKNLYFRSDSCSLVGLIDITQITAHY